jgi:hypothetical protein
MNNMTLNQPMKRLFAGSFLLLLPFITYGQQASIATTSNQIAKTGGTLTIRATANYEEAPGAIGWSLVLPPGWSLLRTSGPCLPEIAPPAGANGKLEWAFVTVPVSPAQFEFTVCYPAGQPAGSSVEAEMFLCANGESKSIATNRLTFFRRTERLDPHEK